LENQETAIKMRGKMFVALYGITSYYVDVAYYFYMVSKHLTI